MTTGFAESAYTTAGNSRALTFANGTNSRVFDTVNQQPMLNSINLQLIHNAPIGGKIELTAGQDADVLASYPTANNNSFDVTNAYLSGTAGAFTLIAGKFSTLAGAEVLEAPSDVNYSRSILFGYAVPFTHTGVRLTWAATSALSLIAGVNNGWDNTKGPGSGARTAEGGIAYTNKNLTVTTQGYSGTERISDAAWTNPAAFPAGFDATTHRSLIDAVATYKFGPVLTGTVNYDSGRQDAAPVADSGGTLLGLGPARWNGGAGYLSAQLAPKLALTGRYEVFNDPQGARTSYAQRWNEGTLTFAYAPSSALLFRLEGRADHSDHSVWAKSDGSFTNTLSTLAVEAVVKF